MKKALLTLGLVLTMSFAVNAQDGFFRGGEDGNRGIGGGTTGQSEINLPGGGLHNQNGDQGAPLGSGLLILSVMGGAYALRKRNNK